MGLAPYSAAGAPIGLCARLGKKAVGLRDEEYVSAGFRIAHGSRDLQRFQLKLVVCGPSRGLR
jgi:hypothetical protein